MILLFFVMTIVIGGLCEDPIIGVLGSALLCGIVWIFKFANAIDRLGRQGKNFGVKEMNEYDICNSDDYDDYIDITKL